MIIIGIIAIILIVVIYGGLLINEPFEQSRYFKLEGKEKRNFFLKTYLKYFLIIITIIIIGYFAETGAIDNFFHILFKAPGPNYLP